MTEASKYLMGLFEQGQLAPCWIVTGPLDSGRSFARQMALAILSSPRNGHGMVFDKVERHITNGTYGNLLTLTKANEDKEMSVESVSPLHEFLQRRPLVPGARVVILDSLDLLNRFGANSVLKALEEPPQDTYIFLLSGHLASVLPTIRSRCQMIAVDDQNVATSEKPGQVHSIAEQLLDRALRGDFTAVPSLCEKAVAGDKANYDALANAVFDVLYQRVTVQHRAELAEAWLLTSHFWQDAKTTHLDLQNAFYTMLAGIHQPELLR